MEESKAELGLKSLQVSCLPHTTTSPSFCAQMTQSDGTYSHESPKFYKKDLLAVLRERNELKEQLDAVREELNMAKL